MSVIINARGTSIPYFKIGKNGSTLYQGTSNPAQTYTVTNGDIWFDTSSNNLKFRSSGDWVSGTGTVSTVSVVTSNGVSGTVANSTSAPAITLTLGAITPTSVAATGSVTGSNLSGTNTGDQTITLTGDVTGGGTGSFAATLATVNSSPQTDALRKITVNAKGLVTATSAAAAADITTALGYTPVNRAGDTFTGTLTSNGTATITGLPNPSNSGDVATKAYVDSTAGGGGGLTMVEVSTQTQTASSGNLYVMTYTIAQSAITLPANPATGATVAVANFTGRSDLRVDRNGKKILQENEDFYIDRLKVTVTFRFVNNAIGWIIV